MNFKTTFVLLVLVIIGVGLWIVAGQREPAAEQEDAGSTTPAETRYVLDPRPEGDKVVRVEFERHDRPTLVFERSEKEDQPDEMGDWLMIEPLASATESYRVDGLARLLSGLQYQRSIETGTGEITLADAGLEPPAATLKVTEKDGTESAVLIGKKVALSNNVYVRVADAEEILVVTRDLSREIEREVNEYRAKRLLTLAAADAHSVHIEHDGTTYDFTRGTEKQWVINQPVKAYALSDKVRAMVEALGRVRVEEYLDDAPESLGRYGLDTPVLTITVVTERTEEVTPETEEGEEPATQPAEPLYKTVVGTYALQVGDFADLQSTMRCVKLPDRPWVASVPQSQLDKLFPKLSELRDPSVTRVKANDVTRLELTRDGTTVTLEKQAGSWKGTGELAELEQEAVTALLRAFEDVNAIDYIDQPQDPAQYGLDRPRAVLTVTTSGSVEPLTLRVGADTPSGHNTYVQVTGQTPVMVISAQRAAEFLVEPLALRSREITSFAPDQIKRVAIRHGDKTYKLERKPGGRTWKMLEPAGAPPNPSAIRELANDLSRLRARQVVAKDDNAAHGLDQPALTIEFDVEQPAMGPPPTSQEAEPEPELVTHTLLVGRPAEAVYARYDDVPYVFELDQTVYNVFTAEFIKPGLFDIDSGDVTYLKIEAPGGTVEFEHDGEQWTYPPDRFLQLSQKKVGDFVTDLAGLRVSAYVAYRDGDPTAHGLADAPVTVTLRLKDESTITLKVDQVRAGELPRKAAWIEEQRIFLLRQAEAEKLMRGLDFYVKPEVPDEATDEEKPSRPRPHAPTHP